MNDGKDNVPLKGLIILSRTKSFEDVCFASSYNDILRPDLKGDVIIGKYLLSVTGAKGVEQRWDAV